MLWSRQKFVCRAVSLFYILICRTVLGLGFQQIFWITRAEVSGLAGTLNCRDQLMPAGSLFIAPAVMACLPEPDKDGAPENLRHFPDPDASLGWDSDLDKYYFGHTLFQLSCYNAELMTDIPLLLHFTSVGRHDSVSFLAAFHEMGKYMTALSVENICLDSAMDNYPTCRLLEKESTGVHRPE